MSNIGHKFNLFNVTKESQSYTTQEKVSSGWFSNKQLTPDQESSNSLFIKRYIQAINDHLGFNYGSELVSILAGIFGKESAELEEVMDGKNALTDRQVERMTRLTSLVMDMHARLGRLDRIMLVQPKGISAEEFEQLKKEYLSQNDASARHSLLMKFVVSHGYEKDIILPSFMRSIAQENVRDMSAKVAVGKVKREIEKFNLFRAVAACQGEAFSDVNVNRHNTAEKLIESIYKAAYPFELLSTESLIELDNARREETLPNQKALDVLQNEINLLQRMSMDLSFFIKGGKLEFIDLSQFVHIPQGFLSGSEYKSLASFKVSEFKQELKAKNWMQLAVYNAGKMQFFAPDPSPVFNIDVNGGNDISLGATNKMGLTSSMVSENDRYFEEIDYSNAETLKVMGGYMTAYFLMSVFIDKMDIKKKLEQAAYNSLPAPIISDDSQINPKSPDVIPSHDTPNKDPNNNNQEEPSSEDPTHISWGPQTGGQHSIPVAIPPTTSNPRSLLKPTGNGSFLAQIQGGTKLKRVTTNAHKQKQGNQPRETGNTAVDALVKVMATRRIVVAESDEESDNDNWE